ncbi:MAG: hypothetical protein PVJ75_17040, partial [Chloroflexota bacterium]
MGGIVTTFRNNRVRFITLAVIFVIFVMASQAMETKDWAITVMRGLSVGMLTFLVASGLSLIFGLMDVLNLAHGEMFMLGAYAGWTVFVRPDTFVDVVPLVAMLAAGIILVPVFRALLVRAGLTRLWLWIVLAVVGIAVLILTVPHYSIAIWDPDVYAESPITFSLALSQGNLVLPQVELPAFEPLISLLGAFVGIALLALAVVGFRDRNKRVFASMTINRRYVSIAVVLLVIGFAFHFANDGLTEALLGLSTTARFFLAIGVAILLGLALGVLVEVTLIRPLYQRPIYQLMLTLGLSFIIIEVVRVIWGRPEFTMPKAA